jgi:hypothetical protein
VSNTHERKFAAAEGLLNHIDQVEGRMNKIAAIMCFAQRIYDAAREHEREDNYGIANQN